VLNPPSSLLEPHEEHQEEGCTTLGRRLYEHAVGAALELRRDGVEPDQLRHTLRQHDDKELVLHRQLIFALVHVEEVPNVGLQQHQE
jgi:hypothetical protein